MKIMKKLATLLLTLCLVLPAFPIVAEAANGSISFTDPSTAAGEVVEVACALRSSEGSVDGFNITLQYDPAYLAFQGGTGITAGDPGVITYYGTGDGSNLLRFTMQFQALQPGSTAIQVVSATATTTAGDAINCTSGASTITIAEGTVPVEETPVEEEPVEETPAEDVVEVTIGKQKYTLSEAFESTSLSEGFEETTGKYDGKEYKMAQQSDGKAKLAYLIDEEGEGGFFLYDEETEKFSPFVQVAVSSTSSIILLQDVKDVKMPENYKKTELTINSYDFPAWEDSEHEDFYLVYAMDQNGEKSFYQYDEKEGSYQRFAFVEKFDAADEKEEPVKETGNSVLIISILAILVLAVAVVVLALKNRKLNDQLDNVYDEYGIEEDVIRLDRKEDDGYLDDDDNDEFEVEVENSDENVKKVEKDTEEKQTEELEDLDDDFDFDDDDFDVDFLDLDE